LSDVIDNKVRLLNESDYDAIISDVMIIDEKSKRNAPISNNFSSQEFRTLKGFWTGMKIIFKSTI
jgi:hypothetical protein